jgi:hypothetical protein
MPWFTYWGEKYYAENIPNNIVPIHPDPEEPNKPHHTPAQIRWRQQMIRTIIRRKKETEIALHNGWSSGVNSAYAKRGYKSGLGYYHMMSTVRKKGSQSGASGVSGATAAAPHSQVEQVE